MNVCFRGLLLVVVLALGPSAVAADDFKLEPGFKPLFKGKADAYKGRFKLTGDVLVIDPKVKGDVRIMTDRKFSGDVHIKFEYKPGPGCNNDLFLRGQKFDLKKPDVKNLKEGEWNEFEIVIMGDQIEFKNNGEVQRKGKVKSAAGTPFEIRAEFGPVEFRRMRVKGGEK
jgi:hypothetical protein